jgi:hypothetical protein
MNVIKESGKVSVPVRVIFFISLILFANMWLVMLALFETAEENFKGFVVLGAVAWGMAMFSLLLASSLLGILKRVVS